ncbi:CotH kinase family protein [Marinimicrobium locisalis]|uniref:CotH kinase family protein n=1 Tax=Marinimicrobium locisalis TaxID=546022 RepID=UPI0032219FC5
MKISAKRLRRGLLPCALGITFFATQAVQAQTADCEYIVSNEWGGGATATIRITNNSGSTIDGWSLEWSYQNNTVTNSWNANISGNNPYTASDLGWNATLTPGAEIEFGLQLNTQGGGAETPALSGGVCESSAPTPSSSSSSQPSQSSSAPSSSTPSTGGQQCDWYGSLYPLCDNQNSGWGWESNQSCVGADTCSSQNGNGGIVGGPDPSSSSSSSFSSSSSSVSSSSPSSSSASSSIAPPDEAGDIVIREIVAKSDNDDFLEGNDWIELYNNGDQPVDLGTYSLADDNSELMPLPTIVLEAGDYVVIAAVDDEDENPPSPSVPFKLGSDDEVTLYYNGGVVDYLSWFDGDAPEGGSYGRLGGAEQTLNPTPGAANEEYTPPPGEDIERGNPTGNSALRISEAVAKSDRPSFYDDRDWVELVNTGSNPINLSDYSLTDDSNPLESLPDLVLQPGEQVVVLAGDDPVTDGSPYVSFGLGRDDSVSLFRGEEEVDYLNWGRDQSKNGRSYGRLNGADTILYPTPGYDNVDYVLFSQEEVFRVDIEIDQQDWQAILNDPQAEEYYPASMVFNGARIDNVGFRTKGQASLNFVSNTTRYGFKVDTNEYEDQKFMGMKKLVLNASFSDPSMMRDVLSYKIMREAGVPAPRTSYVDLWVAGEHIGLYQLIEMIDSEFIERHFPEDDENDDKGDLYKGELMQTLEWQGNDISTYREGLRLKLNEETIGTPEEGDALLRFLDTLNNGPDRLAHVDNDLMIKYLAALVLTGNMDSYIGGTANNFYLYEERYKDEFTMLPWDFNLAFGMWGDGMNGLGGGWGGGGWGGSGGQTCDVVDHVIDNPVSDTNSRPLVDALLNNDALRQQYHSELQQLLDGVYNPATMEQEINRIANLIDPYVQDDPTKYFTYDEWRTSLTQDLPDNSNISGGRGANTYGPAPGLLSYITEKANNVQRQLNGEIPSSNNGGSACPPN